MSSYLYKNGQQPLTGYTIKRGVGRGGFGEVYFAVSDSGKEVALKTLRGRADVELRGVAHCLNLKHPNLVHIYDQKTDDQGNAWIVMEYILGESLADVLDRHPQGLPMHLAKDWFQSLARAVSFLHDHGVLHRDLKPANVFIENGTLKVGDYGLCKTVGSPSERQTRNVGTVHYMAPEIGNGKYGRSVDIYACGAILYEMLVGRPPFDGDSDAEVLIKHSTETPDLSLVPAPYREVVARGLNKDPEKRYTSMSEFARAVEAIPIGTTMAQPIMAGSAMPAAAGALPVTMISPAAVPPPLPQKAGPPVAQIVPPYTPATPLPMSSESMPIPVKLPIAKPPVVNVGLMQSLADLSGGLIKSAVICSVLVIPWMFITQTFQLSALGKMFFTSFAICAGVMLVSFRSSVKQSAEWPLRFRLLVVGMLVGVLFYWLDGQQFGGGYQGEEELTANDQLLNILPIGKTNLKNLSGFCLYFGACLSLCRWWHMTARDRKESWGLGNLFAAGLFSFGLLFLWPYQTNPVEFGFMPLLIASLSIPLASAWTAPPPPLPKKLRAR